METQFALTLERTEDGPDVDIEMGGEKPCFENGYSGEWYINSVVDVKTGEELVHTLTQEEREWIIRESLRE